MSDLSRISVGIPTRNRAHYVSRAIRSVLNQTYSNVEVVVSDNASTDGTPDALEEFSSDPRVVVLHQKTNIGLTGNFNACLGRVTGEYFLMLSDDDFLDPRALEQLLGPFHRSTGAGGDDVGMVWCRTRVVDANGKHLWTTDGGPALEDAVTFLTGFFDGTRGTRFCSVFIRTSDARAVGSYHIEHGPICDVGNWTLVTLLHPLVAFVDEPLTNYTIHTSTATTTANFGAWVGWSERILDDLVASLRRQGREDEIPRLQNYGREFVASTLGAILAQTAGRKGWLALALREVLRARAYFFTPRVALRFSRNAWKLLKLRFAR